MFPVEDENNKVIVIRTPRDWPVKTEESNVNVRKNRTVGWVEVIVATLIYDAQVEHDRLYNI